MAAVYNRNEERARALEKQVAAGQKDPDVAAARIAALRAVPDYWVKVYDGPKPIRQQADPPTSIRAAEKLEARLKGEIQGGTHIPTELLKTTLGAILDAYLAYMAGKSSFASTKSRARAAAPIRHVKLEAWHNNPKLIERHLDDDTPDTWGDRSIHHYAKLLQFAVQRFIDSHQKLNIKNPVLTAIIAMDLDPGLNRREVVPSDLEVAMLVGEARQKGYPPYLAHLLTFLRETGLREIEALSLRWEKVVLDWEESRRIRPWVEVRLRKKKKYVIRRVPLNPRARRALQAIRDLAAGPTETGFAFPVRNFPGKIYRRIRAKLALEHINVHDFRKSWSLEHLDKGRELRKEVRGHDTDEMDEYYLVLGLKEAEAIYDEDWKKEAVNVE
jgi:integrase